MAIGIAVFSTINALEWAIDFSKDMSDFESEYREARKSKKLDELESAESLAVIDKYQDMGYTVFELDPIVRVIERWGTREDH